MLHAGRLFLPHRADGLVVEIVLRPVHPAGAYSRHSALADVAKSRLQRHFPDKPQRRAPAASPHAAFILFSPA